MLSCQCSLLWVLLKAYWRLLSHWSLHSHLNNKSRQGVVCLLMTLMDLWWRQWWIEWSILVLLMYNLTQVRLTCLLMASSMEKNTSNCLDFTMFIRFRAMFICMSITRLRSVSSGMAVMASFKLVLLTNEHVSLLHKTGKHTCCPQFPPMNSRHMISWLFPRPLCI